MTSAAIHDGGRLAAAADIPFRERSPNICARSFLVSKTNVWCRVPVECPLMALLRPLEMKGHIWRWPDGTEMTPARRAAVPYEARHVLVGATGPHTGLIRNEAEKTETERTARRFVTPA